MRGASGGTKHPTRAKPPLVLTDDRGKHEPTDEHADERRRRRLRVLVAGRRRSQRRERAAVEREPQGEPQRHESDPTKAKDHKGRPGLRFTFPSATCATCPLREQCVGGTKGRSIFVGRHHDRIAAARAAQAETVTKVLLRRRSKIERKIDHLQDLGMRTARYRRPRKTRLQALLAATVAISSGWACSARSTRPVVLAA